MEDLEKPQTIDQGTTPMYPDLALQKPKTTSNGRFSRGVADFFSDRKQSQRQSFEGRQALHNLTLFNKIHQERIITTKNSVSSKHFNMALF